MDFYFSGVASADERAMLADADVTHLLVDPIDLPHVLDWPGSVALDCGAYRRSKGGHWFGYWQYQAIASARPFTFITAYEEIGADPTDNYHHFHALRNALDPSVTVIPVYQWNTERDWLYRYLDESPVVGIGGMVHLLRAKTPPFTEHRRAEAVDALAKLADTWPRRFHLFGGCWLPVLEQLRALLHSADTSKWLDGRRYRLSIFTNTRTGHLSIAPSRALGIGDWDGRALSVDNARNLHRFFAA